MIMLLKRINLHAKSKDTFSWFLVVLGVGLIAMVIESLRLHNEVSPSGGHHGDVAGGLSLLGFYFRMSLFVLVFACGAALLAKSKLPIIGSTLGIVAVIPVGLVIGIFNSLLWGLSPWLATPFPYLVGGALIVAGIMRKSS